MTKEINLGPNPQNILQQKVDILALNRLKIVDQEGQTHLISGFWKEKTSIFIFLRHFGCVTCRAHVEIIWKKKDELTKNATKIIFIGNGESEYIKIFKQDLNLGDAPIFTDPTSLTFEACGFHKNPIHTADPRSLGPISKLLKSGYTQGPVDKRTGNIFQMGGVVAIKPPGIVVYHFASEYAGDYDNHEDWQKISEK
jgi:hypothetical protein